MNKATSLIVVAAAFLFLHPQTAVAQSVSFTGVQTTVPASGLSGPQGVAVDGAGNVFIADPSNSRVVEVPAGGGPQTTVGSGLSTPIGVAVDGAGDVFIADQGINQVVEVPAGGGPQTTVGSGLYTPKGVAVDGAGDVFIADEGHSRVVEVPAGCTNASCQTTVGSGLFSPDGVAVDGGGDVFIADTNNHRVVEVPAGGGTQVTVASGLDAEWSVAVDGGGNVFVAYTGNSLVVEVPAGGGSQTAVGSGLSYPQGVGVDGAGDVFIGDTGNNRVVEVQRVAVNFGSANVCPGGQTTPVPCSQTLTLNYSVNSDTTFGSNPTILTQGASSLDFTLSSNTCTGAITAGNSCTVNVQFAPLAPGLRLGAVQLMDNSANLLATTFIHGIGQGPAMAFGPGVQTVVSTESAFPRGLAIDGAGDIFFTDAEHNRVVEIPAGGGTQTTVGSGLNTPMGVALDGAGDVFITENTLNLVVEVPAGGGAQTLVPASGLSGPQGVAVDGAGNVFIADTSNSRIVEVPAGGGVQTTVPATGLNYPDGVAVDGAGNVLIADTNNDRVVEVPAGGGAQTTVATGLNKPTGVAVDGAGDVFIADYLNSRVVEVPAGGGPQTTVGSGLTDPYIGLAVDGAGTVFIADTSNRRLVEVQRSQPPAFSFATTFQGITSTDSPHSLTVQNIGNQSLNAVAPGLGIGPDSPDSLHSFMQVGGPGTPADCTSTFSLVPGASCNLSVSFTPQAIGSITSAATFTDNALNATAATQNVSLQGTGAVNPHAASVFPTALAYGNQAVNTPSAVKSVTLTSTGTSSLIISNIAFTGSNAGDFGQTNNCTAPSYAPGAKCTISVTFTPSALAPESASLVITDNAATTQTVSLTGIGVQPVVLNPTSLNFGNVGKGSPSVSRSITLNNYQYVALGIVGSITTGNPDFAESDTCGSSVPARGHCVITVTFTPSTLTAESGTVTINDNATTSPQTASLAGTGILPVTLSPVLVNFGNVGQHSPSLSRSVTLINRQTTTLNITSITTGNPDFAESDTCGGSVLKGGQCVITIKFTPSSLGPESGTLSVADTASTTPQTAALSGTGVLPAWLSVPSVNFGSIPQGTPSAAKTVTLYNNLTSALGITSIATGNSDYAESDTCTPSVPVGGHCVITITFTPGVLGADGGTLTITDTAPNSPQTATLVGTGIAQAAVAPTSLALASPGVGVTSSVKYVTLTNNLSTAVTVGAVTFTGANPLDFASPSNTCGGSLGAKSHCTFAVTFTPGGTGPRGATMNINDGANNSPQTVALTGTIY